MMESIPVRSLLIRRPPSLRRNKRRQLYFWLGALLSMAILILLFTLQRLSESYLPFVNSILLSFPQNNNLSNNDSQLKVRKVFGDNINISSMTHRPTTFQHPIELAEELDTIIFLAPQRRLGSIWDIDRFCMLLRAVRSVDKHLNELFGPYTIHIVVAKDYALDPEHMDGPYTAEDRALLRRWAPTSIIQFVEINMYSEDAFEPNITMRQAKEWKEAMPSDFHHGVGYASMCRLWSGRLQQMDFLQRYQYYMRMDDDSLLVDDVPFDPFVKMKEKQLLYAYRRDDYDDWGISQLWETVEPFIEVTNNTPFVNVSSNNPNEVDYEGDQPYNNFHVTAVAFWTSPPWMALWNTMNENHLFFQHRVGDANVHAIACMLMGRHQFEMWDSFPYRHNSNDMGGNWSQPEWKNECHEAYRTYLPL